jgi:predicted permease
VNGDFNVEGRPKHQPGEGPVAEFRIVTPDYFQAIGIPLLKGRTFGSGERLGTNIPVMINETLARRFFPGEDPVGRRLIVLDEKPHEIIGIAGDARQWGLDRPPDPEVYFAYSQMTFAPESTLVVRTTVEPSTLGNSVRAAVRDANRDAPVYRLKTMLEVMSDSVAQRRFNTILMSSFAAVALVLATIGLYGVISYSFAQRTQEIGLRMALGAQRRNVLRMVLWYGFKLAAIGVAVGILASLMLTRILASLLYGVGATDTATFFGGSVFLTFIALVACYVPARRATRIDPMVALRYE